MTAIDTRDLVAALRAVPGVYEAGLEPDEEGGMSLLRLDLDPGVDEAEVASSVGRVLREQFGLGVDADRVQILEEMSALPAQVEDAPAGDDEPGGRDGGVPRQRAALRPAIARMHLVSSGLEVTATVSLTSGERTSAGEARGTASPSGVHRAVANATLRAVELLVDDRVRFELDHLEVTPMGAERTVVVALTLLSGRGTERLTGAAAVREDVRQAVIRATLDALNRRVEPLLS